MHGIIVKGSKNLFTVKPAGTDDGAAGWVACRLKGKVLKEGERVYNPLAPGDRVLFSPDTCLIESRLPRRNKFSRWNEKGRSSQTLAANIDLVLCVTSPASPPFRPRFIDRVLIQAAAENIAAAIVLNKSDLPLEEPDADRLVNFEKIGVPVLRLSAKTGEGFPALEDRLTGQTALLVGQSGVGKTTMLNRLFPGCNGKTGAVNKKFDRGNHTTVIPVLYEHEQYTVIDSPGLRQFIPDGIGGADIALYMEDIAPFAAQCAFGASCTHTSEPGCAVIDAVNNGHIHEDRYQSLLRLKV
ncbi:MAG: ribosome small subunit-dependent GTPase A [Spirochaetaceae bacterium]|jgi:ribosome biogenesis GTPase|nr:ribosome small subunit-dependent GTPase A [Spirochaetaceae bacterium]